jgi:hypothetical protein
LHHLPTGYEEVMQYGMIGYVVPLSRYPDGYLSRKNEPLLYAALASQKNHMAIYLMNIYCNEKAGIRFKKAYESSGKKLDMGKSCIRFRRLDDLPLDVIGDAIALTPVAEFIRSYEQRRSSK